MRWVLLVTGVLASTAFANGRGRFYAGANFGPASVQLGPAWTGYNTSGRPVPLVPITNYTGGYPAGAYNYGYYPYAYWYPQVYQQQPAPPPQPQQVIIEREVVIERAAPQPAPLPPPPPQIIVIERPAPVAQAPAPPPAPLEPPKPLPPRTPGPDVYSWTDSDGVVHYSTRAPGAAVKAKKLATLAK